MKPTKVPELFDIIGNPVTADSLLFTWNGPISGKRAISQYYKGTYGPTLVIDKKFKQMPQVYRPDADYYGQPLAVGDFVFEGYSEYVSRVEEIIPSFFDNSTSSVTLKLYFRDCQPVTSLRGRYFSYNLFKVDEDIAFPLLMKLQF